MIVSLIGMSGAGKTYWGRALEKEGFLLWRCTDLVEKKLEKELQRLGYKGIRNIAKWMGQPFYVEYPRKSRAYLSYESEVMEEILERLTAYPENTNIVIDTSGSIIYLNNKIQNNLKRLTKIVSLDVPQSVKDVMYKLYLRDPKPVIWGNSFNQKENESNYVALSRCYPQLLEYRTQKYRELAHITVDYFELKRKKCTTEDFLKLI